MVRHFGGSSSRWDPMLGYFSGEWVFLAVLGLGAAALFSHASVAAIDSATIKWAVALLSSAVFYAFLRLGGRTPIGITYESHPAAQGHPILSLFASLIMFAMFGFQIVTS